MCNQDSLFRVFTEVDNYEDLLKKLKNLSKEGIKYLTSYNYVEVSTEELINLIIKLDIKDLDELYPVLYNIIHN